MAEAMVNLIEGFSKVHHQDVHLTSTHHVLKQLFCWDLPASCPTNGHLSLPNGKRYGAPSDEQVDYATAQARCAAEGGTVALPLDSNEQAYLVFFKNCLNQNAQFWLGLSRPVGTWVDSQGSALGGFSAWAPGEPDERTKLCSRLVFGAQSNSERRNKWADAPCGESFRYICKTIIQEDGSLQIRIYRKPTHTDQYLNFDSNHPLDHKLGVIRTLSHRANAIVSDPQDLETEKSHLTQALKTCGYPQWAINKATCPNLLTPNPQQEQSPRGQEQQGPCQETYIGETERSLKARFQEHTRPSSASSEVSQHIHIESPGHHVSLDTVRILDTEQDYFLRGVKEAIYIRAHHPTLNRDGGRHRLPDTFDPVLTSHFKEAT
ncbi:hypothetical protein Bbelb_446080 [Branchiostoma belcheri]|nr:hypothetical protein Bbelb_446080 [Branchiostoma belcheri]